MKQSECRMSILILSPDSSLIPLLEDEVPDDVAMDAGPLTSESMQIAAAVRPDLVVFDCRRIVDGGHAIDRLIEQFQIQQSEIRILLLTGGDPPEILARRVACSGIDCVRNAETSSEILAALAPFLPPPDADASAATPEERDERGRSVAQVVSHRFETQSPHFKQMLDDLTIAAAHDVTILLIGETGSGKTYLSQLVHEASPRRTDPFIHVACGALPRELIESELFGHVKGAFTSAHADKEGKFIAAGRGTILLDEIDVLGPEQQVKLLRVIETGEFEQVGSNRTFRSQARLVVASNLDLQPLVEQGRFRPDLYYRLNMLKFEIPPLRQRKVDIVPLVKKFVARFQQKHGVRIDRIDDSMLEALLAYPWPGNVRELEHVVQRAVIYCRDGILTREHLPSHIVSGLIGPTNDPSVVLSRRPITQNRSLEHQVALTEKEIIEQALFKNNFSRTNTARDLGISRVTLYNKMKKYDMLK
ncbi:MAG: sigma 54-interacting transcriptional regulator [Maioricimonas sp. JB049]